MLLLSYADFFIITFSFKNTIRVANGLDPDQDQQSVGPDLGPNCLQMLSADDKSLDYSHGQSIKVVKGSDHQTHTQKKL